MDSCAAPTLATFLARSTVGCPSFLGMLGISTGTVLCKHEWGARLLSTTVALLSKVELQTQEVVAMPIPNSVLVFGLLLATESLAQQYNQFLPLERDLSVQLLPKDVSGQDREVVNI